jgi:hypothetical protein
MIAARAAAIAEYLMTEPLREMFSSRGATTNEHNT